MISHGKNAASKKCDVCKPASNIPKSTIFQCQLLYSNAEFNADCDFPIKRDLNP